MRGFGCLLTLRESLRKSLIRTTSPGITYKRWMGSARPRSPIKLRRAWPVGLISAATAGSAYYYYDDISFANAAVARSVNAASCIAQIAAAYNATFLRNKWEKNAEARDQRLSECHSWCANKLYELACKNGGIFVKLGQHIGAMTYALPVEYTSAMIPLQDQCPPSKLQDINAMFVRDIGYSLDDLFEYFDPKPIGVASLAQVHAARFRVDGGSAVPKRLCGKEAAVKIQHPNVADYAQVDIETCSAMVRFIKWVFPQFEFEWLADEMRQSLPVELDFTKEAANAERIARVFQSDQRLVVPQIYWSNQRILAMEFMHGSRIDNDSYIRQHRLDPLAISREIKHVWNVMIFGEGFVHCDPHPGNILVRAKPHRWFLSRWLLPPGFELVLLDHGLYRELTTEFRLAYANLWIALISGRADAIQQATFEVFKNGKPIPNANFVAGRSKIPDYKLFASFITGRPWDVITATEPAAARQNSEPKLPEVATEETAQRGIASLRNLNEVSRLREIANQSDFFERLARLLASVPRELLLLSKTNMLIRALDVNLKIANSTFSSDDAISLEKSQLHVLESVSEMASFCATVVLKEEIKQAQNLSLALRLLNLVKCLSSYSYYEFHSQLLVLYIKFKKLQLWFFT